MAHPRSSSPSVASTKTTEEEARSRTGSVSHALPRSISVRAPEGPSCQAAGPLPFYPVLDAYAAPPVYHLPIAAGSRNAPPALNLVAGSLYVPQVSSAFASRRIQVPPNSSSQNDGSDAARNGRNIQVGDSLDDTPSTYRLPIGSAPYHDRAPVPGSQDALSSAEARRGYPTTALSDSRARPQSDSSNQLHPSNSGSKRFQ
ncbi:hypothetical protein MMC28_008467 [Mycoblastus sanguinarius]|nr:hypothetical protein [Mycoblastus sanguinarius]